jgi:hypothetical protein
MEDLTKELLEEYGERVIALAQHLELDLEINEEDYKLNPDEEFETEEEREERIQELKEEREDAIQAIKDELECIVNDYGNTYNYYNQEYMVLTDSEADDAEDEALNNYLEECVYPELPDHLSCYFDDEAWKRDARMDGRGHLLATYDGNEYEETVEGTTYYIYRV